MGRIALQRATDATESFSSSSSIRTSWLRTLRLLITWSGQFMVVGRKRLFEDEDDDENENEGDARRERGRFS